MKKNIKSAFTLVEMVVVAPIVILSIVAFVYTIVTLTGSVIGTNAKNLIANKVQSALFTIQQDLSTPGAVVLSVNNVSLMAGQGYNDDTTNFSNVSASTGNALIIQLNATDKNPLSGSSKLVYLANSPNACNATNVGVNTIMTYNVVYFVKNNQLWRRVLMPSTYSSSGCSTPWQQPSCSPGVSASFCKVLDTLIATGVSNFNIDYFTTSDSIIPNTVAVDQAQSDAARQAAINSAVAIKPNVDISQTIAGRTVAVSRNIRATYTKPVDSLYSFSTMTIGSSRATVTANTSSNTTGTTKAELATYLTNSSQTSINSILTTGTYLDVPGAAGYVYWVVPADGTYRISAKGGGGGPSYTVGAPGSLVQGDFVLQKNDVIWMTVGLAGSQGNLGSTDQAGGSGGGFTVVGKGINSSGKTFVGANINALLVAAGGQGSKEPRFAAAAPANSSSANGTVGTAYTSNWRSQSINGNGAGYGGMTTYGGFGGGNGTDDGYGPAGGYDALYTNTPNSYVDASALNIVRSDAGGAAQWTNGSITITRL